MAMSYHKVFKVPTWVILNQMTKGRSKAVAEWFAEAGALNQPWPGNSFPDAVFAYRGKGYAHALPEKQRFILPVDLLLRAASEHVKTVLGPTSYLAGSVGLPPGQLNRVVEKPEDLVNIFNDLISLEDPIALSQVFQVAERCYREEAPKLYPCWVTAGPAPKSLLTRISGRVITVGDEPSNDVVVGELAKDQLFETLEQFFAPKKD
jgi:hypothetical protein